MNRVKQGVGNNRLLVFEERVSLGDTVPLSNKSNEIILSLTVVPVMKASSRS